MQTLIVKIDTPNHAVQVANFLRTVPYIKSVITKKTDEKLKPLTAADWVRPGRTATDDEIEELCRQMDKPQKEYSLEEAKAKTLHEIKEWKKRNLK